MFKKFFINILLFSVSILLTLTLAEICLRLFYPQIVICRINSQWRADDKVLPYVPKANYKGRMILKDQFDVELTTNSQGFRSFNEYRIDKPAGVTRVIFLGDSFVFGWGVNDNKTFVYSLEKGLSSGNIEVINRGIYGFDICEYREMFDRMLKYNPDIIFLGFCLENDYNISVEPNSDDSEFEYAEKEDVAAKIRHFINNLHLITLVRDRLYITFPKIRNIVLSLGINNKRDIFLKEYPESLNRLLQEDEKILIQMKTIAEEKGIDFVVILIPLKEQVYCRDAINKFSDYDIDRPNKEIAKILKRNKIEYIDLLPGIIDASKKTSKRLYFDTDPHWTRHGHNVVSDLLIDKYGDFIKERDKRQ